MAQESEIAVVRNDRESRYEIRVDGAVAGFTEMRMDRHGRTVLPHTEVDPAFSGGGLGSRLVDDALADLAARGDTIVPVCPFVVKRLREDPIAGLDVVWRRRTDAAGTSADVLP